MTYKLLRSVHPFLHSSPFYLTHQNPVLYNWPDTPMSLMSYNIIIGCFPSHSARGGRDKISVSWSSYISQGVVQSTNFIISLTFPYTLHKKYST